MVARTATAIAPASLASMVSLDLDVVPMVSNSSAYESLQVWHNSPIPFDRDRAANVLATSEVIFVTL